MKLIDLVRMVAHHATKDLGYSMAPMDVIEDLAVIHGREYPGDAEAGWVYDGELRLSSITPELNVEGPFLRFEYVGHLPAWYVFTCQSRAEVEATILGGGGYLNHFTSTTVILHNDVVLPFQVFFRDPSGRERLFEKKKQMEEDDFGTKYPNPRIEWLPASRLGA
jgi:hypothetical protein